MKVIGVTLLCGVLMASAAAPLQADEVDDLLAGKPVVTPEAAPPARPFTSPSLESSGLSPLESATLSESAAWEGGIKQAAKRKSSSPKPARESQPPSAVSLVPEPSAIALGVGAILYFLIFFRRRPLP